MKVLPRVAMAAAGIAFAIYAAGAFSALAASTPTAPRNLKAAAGDQRVVLTWTAPTTGVPTYYQVITSPADYPRTNTSATNITATGLTNGRTYSFAVRALNASGYGPAARITAVPHATPPSAPKNLAATQGPGSGQYTITWDPPATTGSSPDGSSPTIDHYTVRVSPAATCQMISPTSCIASNIADNITFTFTVTATNSRNVTGPAAVVYAPLPGGATIGLQPSAGTSTTSITVTGELFLKNENITLYWDVSTHIAATLVSDDNGSFTKVVKPYKGDKPKTHKLCANVQPKPCANFALQAPPSPSPTSSGIPSPDESPSPSPSAPQASGVRPAAGGGISGLDIITRPPFVFLPIIGILGLLGVLAYWLFSSRRRPMAPTSASVVHHATRPDYMEPFAAPARPPAVPPAASAPWPPVPPAASAWPPVQPAPQAQPPPPAPTPPAPQFQPPPAAPQPPPPAAPPRSVEWPASPHVEGAPDEPPDLPEPSD